MMQTRNSIKRVISLANSLSPVLCAAMLILLLGVSYSSQANSDSKKKNASRWGANYFPNVPLRTHEGETVRFFDDLVKDKVVVINFIYTTCTDVCPVDTARLKTVQEILGDRVGKDIFMYSISIDPARDTPEALADYAERYRVGPGWLFLTGTEQDVLLLRKKLGLYIAGLEEKLDHNMSFIIGNQRTGQWVKRSPMDNPYFIAEQIGSWLTNWKTPSAVSKNNYAEAPELRPPSMGENLFRTRCTVCHTIGEGNIEHTIGGGQLAEADRYRGGPDLMHVTHKRDRDWLSRWIVSPEKMLKEKDPIALRLFAENNEVLMPNLRLNDVEVAALIEYMEAETQRLERIHAGSNKAPEPPGARHSAHREHAHH